MFDALEKFDARPEPFEFYTASELWADDHRSKKMLSYHLDGDIDLSSRNAGFIDRSVDWIASHFSVSPGTEIADFGCGPGLYTMALARIEANVTGIDFSTNSIEYAREVAMRAGLSIRYIVQDYLEFETDNRFDLILMIMCDFCALSPVQRRDLLSRFHTMLAPGGSVLLDVYSLSTFDHTDEQERYGVDISDGLSLDLSHLAHASDVGAVVDLDKLPASAAFRAVNPEDAQTLMLSGGEDYELLFAAPERPTSTISV